MPAGFGQGEWSGEVGVASLSISPSSSWAEYLPRASVTSNLQPTSTTSNSKIKDPNYEMGIDGVNLWDVASNSLQNIQVYQQGPADHPPPPPTCLKQPSSLFNPSSAALLHPSEIGRAHV